MELALDLVLGLVLLARLVAGWRTGVVHGAARVVGVLAGGVLGLFVSGRTWPAMSAWLEIDQSGAVSLLRLAYLAVLTLVGVAIGEGVGLRLARRLTRDRPPGGLNRLVGAGSSLAAGALLIWVLAVALLPVVPIPAAALISQSRVINGIDRALPDQWDSLPRQLTAPLRNVWPQVFPGLNVEPSISAPEPDQSVAQTPAVRQASGSVLKIFSEAPQCRTDSSGSGWVVSPGRVVTNAHVVAGSNEVTVQVGGTGRAYAATVVAFDPDLDLAVLAVNGLPAPALPRATGTSQESVAALGFPGGGPYTVSPSRVRGTIPIVGPDIFGGSGETRQVHTVRGEIHPGNSGGPLVDDQGRVVGTVFAASTVDPQTYFALTEASTKAMLDSAPRLTAPVSTQGCTVG